MCSLQIVLYLFLTLALTRCNFPAEVPAESDPPEAVRATSVVYDIGLADSLALRGAPLTALEAYRRAEERLRAQAAADEEGLGWIRIKIARTLLQSDQPMAAAAQLDTILTRFPGSRWAGEAHAERSVMLIRARAYAQALPHLMKAREAVDGAKAGQFAFLTAYAYHRLNQWQEAVTWYDRSRALYAGLEDYALFYAAECLLQLNRKAEAAARLQQISRVPGESVFLAEATAMLCDYYLERSEADRALAEVRAALDRGQAFSGAHRAGLLLYKGRAHEVADQPDSAAQAYRSILVAYRSTEDALKALEALETVKTRRGASLSDEERLWTGLTYLAHRRYGEAKERFLTLVRSSAVEPQVAVEAEYYLRETQYFTKQYGYAEDGFRAFLASYPDHRLAGDAHLYLARCIRARQGAMRSLPAYLAFVEKYPDHPMAPEALMYVAQRMKDASRYTDAAAYYLRIVAEYPGYKDVEEAHWQAGYCYYQKKDYRQAARVFTQLALDRPNAALAPSALYWAAKAAHKQNHLEARKVYKNVIKTYPATYEAYQAREALDAFGEYPKRRLNGRPDSLVMQAVPFSLDLIALRERFGRNDGETGEAIAQDFRFERAQALLSTGLRDEGVQELQIVYGRNRDNPQALAEITRIYYQHRLYREGIRTAGRLQHVLARDEGHRRADGLIPLLYPTPFWAIVHQAAKEFDLDPLFVLAIMRQESRFDTGISSWAGAQGLMQLMPGTAKTLAQQLRVHPYSINRLYEPEINILLGAKYISDLLKRFKDRPELALAAYNGGPSRVARWVREHGARDMDDFVERINVSETRAFVKAVMNNYAHYTYLLRDRPVLSKDEG